VKNRPTKFASTPPGTDVPGLTVGEPQQSPTQSATLVEFDVRFHRMFDILVDTALTQIPS
jgi:hypothetical protein